MKLCDLKTCFSPWTELNIFGRVSSKNLHIDLQNIFAEKPEQNIMWKQPSAESVVQTTTTTTMSIFQ